MLEINRLRQHKDEIIQQLTKRYFEAKELIEQILELDVKQRSLKTEIDQNQAELNKSSKAIGLLMREGKKEEAEQKKREVAELKQHNQPLQKELSEASEELEQLLVQIPNVPHESVSQGKSEDDNVVISRHGEIPEFAGKALPHWELAKKYDLIDFELGNKITGSGFPLYKGKGAQLQWALISYFLQFNIQNGYTPYQPPLMVNEASAYGTGQLPDKEGQMYYAGEDNLYLIPTAEVPLTNIYRNSILKEDDLPVKMTGYTPCFRREAGSYGKDVRGLNRLHQFDKVELVRVVKPETSYDVLNEMVGEVESLLKSLQLPYRILRLCGGDLSFTSALTYDFEIYSAAQERWLEVSSISNFETYQSNRMKIRMKGKDGKKQLLHTLNGSSLALPRILAGLLENNQEKEGIRIPEVLQPFLGIDKIQ
ncbi:MAG TPA: serine--tRNA ligase [Chitinophagaceae bacterium]|nr:serine--tRNA ligase [Chitinophagaceae bacterium]